LGTAWLFCEGSYTFGISFSKLCFLSSPGAAPAVAQKLTLQKYIDKQAGRRQLNPKCF
jgi:hypothetical protein